MEEVWQSHHKQGYAWISLALTLPVFLWPAFLLFGFTPSFGTSIEQNWLISSCCLLIAVVVADSILFYQHIRHAIISSIWIMLASSIASLAIRNADLAWFIAALFALRSLHITYQLWNIKPEYQPFWQWAAWWRDSSTAFIMFLWLNYWPK